MITATALAQQLGCDCRTIRRACQRAGLEKVNGIWQLTVRQVVQVKRHVHKSPGNPTFGAKN
jgi:hypothetical protein